MKNPSRSIRNDYDLVFFNFFRPFAQLHGCHFVTCANIKKEILTFIHKTYAIQELDSKIT